MRNKALLFAFSLAATAMVAADASADLQDCLYDFTDSYYRKNGINPAAISGRRQAVAPLAVQDGPMFWYQRDVRALLTIPAYDHSSNPWFFTVLGGFNTSAFTPDSAGANAKAIADRSFEYVFPSRGVDPLSLGGGRQSNLLDMRNGYFSNNRLGLWVHVWVNYTDKAFNTYGGKQMLSSIAQKNGLALDGTPLIKTVGDIDNLYKGGYVTKTKRPQTDNAYYAICPVIKDPTDGGIAPDQFLSYVKKADGTPLEPSFLRNFQSLQLEGRWSN
ncbi:MAG: hypothetical protein ACAH95_11010 [Fimbriimonas sp.]